jgi:hypothetical protein
MDKKLKISNPKTDGYQEVNQTVEFREFSPEQVGLRVIELDGEKIKYNVIQEDPFNLWRITPSRGPVPDELSGRYTSVDMATQAIQLYISKRDRIKLGA